MGIRVNGIHPGYIWGDSVEWYFNHLAEKRGVTFQEVYDEVAAETCLRLPAELRGDRRRRGVLGVAAGQAGHRPDDRCQLRPLVQRLSGR